MKRLLFLLPCILFAACNQVEVPTGPPVPISDPKNAGGWVLNESVSDEFNGESLDLEKWNLLGLDGNYYGEWKGRAPSQFASDNVAVKEGNLTITSKWDPEFKFSDTTFNNGFKYGQPAPITTGCIISKAKFKHGYMEMRCRAADGPVSSAFWTTGADGEIDVFEHYGENPGKPHVANKYHTSFHDWRKGSPTFGKRIWTNEHQLDFRVADDFHIYGFEWNENDVKIYVDGRLVNCVTKEEMGDKWVATNEQKVWIDSETFDWEVKPPELKASHFGDGQEFVVDYCRIWQREGDSAGCEPRVNLLANPGFESGMESWTGMASVFKGGKTGDSSAQVKVGEMIEQTVSLKPNTTYILSAWVKSPVENQTNLWLKGRLAVKNYGGEEADVKYIFPYFHEKSLQFKTGPEAATAVVFFSNEPKGNPTIVDDIELVEAPSAAN